MGNFIFVKSVLAVVCGHPKRVFMKKTWDSESRFEPLAHVPRGSSLVTRPANRHLVSVNALPLVQVAPVSPSPYVEGHAVPGLAMAGGARALRGGGLGAADRERLLGRAEGAPASESIRPVL